MKRKKYKVLVLNADYLPLTVVTWQRAIVLEMDGRVNMLDFYKNDSIKDGHGREYPIPAVVACRKYIRRDTRYPPFSRKNIFIRDETTCQYCEKKFDPRELTFDHVIPRSKWSKDDNRGSPTCWENIVTCCISCNRQKGNKTCEQAKMFPIVKPIRPENTELFLGISPWRDSIPAEWFNYLKYLPKFKSLQYETQEA